MTYARAKIRENRRRTVTLLALLAVLATVLVTRTATATHQPADKVTASGSTIEWLTTSATGRQEVKILEGKLKTSSPTDLLLSVTSECALWTSTANQDSDASETKASVEMYIKIIDAAGTKVVPVTSDSDGNGVYNDPDDGKVVFCNRAQRMETEFIDGNNDDTLRIRSYLKTRSANGFNWVALNLGNGVHTIEVWAVLDASVVESGDISATFPDVQAPAAAAVGKRTLVVEPSKLANDAKI